MQVVYVSGEQPKIINPSIFLAGPTPRDHRVLSWRPQAIDIFQEMNFNGQIFVPERGDGGWLKQYEWEWEHLHGATVIMFWLPREMGRMPALTTNIEFGLYLNERPTTCIYGRPDWAEKNRYLDWLFEKITEKKPETELKDTIRKAIELATTLSG